ncbi:MAG TPA: bifunctional polysaccharide deacetylase/glycosyltransferase family 2 protein [Acidimicrobiales bacterium]|nr:bifunctional polysaccharide deacetylase/glycosyltransferase family 2 protein [Acidimicrobiales bacterium]
MLASGLLVDGYSRRASGHSGTRGIRTGAGSLPGMDRAGALLDLRGADVVSASGQARTVALTFDDGPDPRWTPQILALLERHHIPATFFVVGSRVLAHPGLVRREIHEGNAVGSHTFVHADVAALPAWQRNLELTLTQSALASAAGIHTGLFRPPYSSEPGAVTARQLRAWRAIGRQGYLIVLADRDAEDWRRPGVARILANAAPDAGRGTVIMMHDAGGDRSETVAAAEQLVTSLQAQGYRFTTVPGLLGLAPAAGDVTIGNGPRLQGIMVASAARAGSLTVSGLRLLAWPIAALILGRCLLLWLFARRHRADPSRRRTDPAFTPPVSIIVPAYNEAVGIATAVRSLASSDYPFVEVIVVDDGSTDGTAGIVAKLGLPNVEVVSQPNSGKAAALNAGIRLAHNGIIVTVDGDTAFEPDTVRWLVQPFADPRVGAVSGNTKVSNRRGILGRWQHTEYVMGFNLDRRLYDILECMPTVPGAVGAFRREVLEQVGGVSTDTLAEDTDLTMAVVRSGWRVVFEERARAWTEAPSTISALWKQRYRWSYGTLQAMWKHRGALREGGPLGRRGIPYLLLFQVLLPVLAPVIDLYALFGLVSSRPAPLVLYWVVLNLLGLVLALYSFRLDHEPAGPLWSVPLQQFVYRQLTYLVVIQAAVTAVLGSRLRWHKLERTGEFAPAGGRT